MENIFLLVPVSGERYNEFVNKREKAMISKIMIM
jgi:hypothetical protein